MYAVRRRSLLAGAARRRNGFRFHVPPLAQRTIGEPHDTDRICPEEGTADVATANVCHPNSATPNESDVAARCATKQPRRSAEDEQHNIATAAYLLICSVLHPKGRPTAKARRLQMLRCGVSRRLQNLRFSGKCELCNKFCR